MTLFYVEAWVKYAAPPSWQWRTELPLFFSVFRSRFRAASDAAGLALAVEVPRA